MCIIETELLLNPSNGGYGLITFHSKGLQSVDRGLIEWRVTTGWWKELYKYQWCTVFMLVLKKPKKSPKIWNAWKLLRLKRILKRIFYHISIIDSCNLFHYTISGWIDASYHYPMIFISRWQENITNFYVLMWNSMQSISSIKVPESVSAVLIYFVSAVYTDELCQVDNWMRPVCMMETTARILQFNSNELSIVL